MCLVVALQCCIFIPAILSHTQGPQILRTNEVKLIVFVFYQLQARHFLSATKKEYVFQTHVL